MNIYKTTSFTSILKDGGVLMTGEEEYPITGNRLFKLDPELKQDLNRIQELTRGAFEREDWPVFLGLSRLYERLIKEVT